MDPVDLYALPPEEFTPARDAAVKLVSGAQAKALKALRRPTVAAWVVNTLVRRDHDLLEQLLELGNDLAQAQSSRDAAALRTLTDQRRQLVGAVARRAEELADRELSAAVREEVAATLEAALSDEASAAAVRTGALVRGLRFAGFGGVDLDGAVADLPPVRQPAPPRPAKGRTGKGAKAAPAAPSAKVQKLEAAALQAQGALDDAVRHAERVARDGQQAHQDLAELEDRVRTTQARVSDLRAAVAVAEEDHATATSRRTKAAKAVADLDRKAARATAAVQQAQEAADQARKDLDALRRASPN